MKVASVLIMLTCRDLFKSISFIQICHQQNKILADTIYRDEGENKKYTYYIKL